MLLKILEICLEQFPGFSAQKINTMLRHFRSEHECLLFCEDFSKQPQTNPRINRQNVYSQQKYNEILVAEHGKCLQAIFKNNGGMFAFLTKI